MNTGTTEETKKEEQRKALEQWRLSLRFDNEVLANNTSLYNDSAALCEAFNNWSDSLHKDGEISTEAFESFVYVGEGDDTHRQRNLICEALLQEAGISLDWQFVPFSKSRNAAEKDKTINWLFILSKEGTAPYRGDYAQGIGHIPNFNNIDERKVYGAELVHLSVEKGRYSKNPKRNYPLWNTKPLPKPTAADILYCLTTDSTDEFYSFEEWAGTFGYDTDSRKAEETYLACRKQTREAQRILGHILMNELSKVMQDY